LQGLKDLQITANRSAQMTTTRSVCDKVFRYSLFSSQMFIKYNCSRDHTTDIVTITAGLFLSM